MRFRTKLLITLVGIVVLSLLPMTYLQIQLISREGKIATERFSQEAYQAKRNLLRTLINTVETIHEKYLAEIHDGGMSEEEARHRFKEIVRAMRYDGGNGYFWLHECFSDPEKDSEAVVVMHPVAEEVVGRRIGEFNDFEKLERLFVEGRVYNVGDPELHKRGISGSDFLLEMNRVCRTSGSGFVTYFWKKPLPDGTSTEEGYRKLAFVAALPEWNWVVGTGVYVDDITKEVAKRRHLVKQRIEAVIKKNAQVAFVLLVLAVCAALVIAEILSRSVDEIEEYAKAVTHGDYTRLIPVYGTDEFRDMREAFRTMQEAIAERQEELRRRAEEFEKINERLETLNLRKNAILATISHELRTPIALIRGYCELLLQERLGPLTGLQKEKMRQCLKKCDALAEMISEMLAVSRMGDREEKPEVLDMEVLVREAVLTVCEDHPNRKFEVRRVGGDTSEKALVRMRRIAAERTLLNLLSNAVKFSGEETSVTVEISVEREYVEVAVIDYGIGIPEKEQENIFRRFYQVDQSYSKKHGGLGLGLAIVKESVEWEGGTVEVKSRPGKGATFIIRLPRA